MMLRRPLLTSFAGLVLLGGFSLAGCGTASISSAPKPDAAVVQTLAPSGVLKIGVYKGSPTSLVTAADGKSAGVAHDVGQQMASRLGVPAQVVVYERVAQVLEALKAGNVDITFTNASPARQLEFGFTKPLLSLELGYLVPVAGSIQTLADVDKAGHRVGVSLGSSSQAALGNLLKQAEIKTFANLLAARRGLTRSSAALSNDIDAFATNKGILNEMLDDLKEKGAFKILDGRWGAEHMGIAIAKERVLAAPFVQAFGDELKQSGELARIAARAGLRGLVEKE